MFFWMWGTRQAGTSTPKSPRATMMPSATSKMASKFSTASEHSILAMILMPSPPCPSKNRRTARTPSASRTNDAATKSTSCPIPNSRSVAVLVRERRQGKRRARHVHGLALAERACVPHDAADVGAVHALHLELDKPVVHEDGRALPHGRGQARAALRDQLGRALHRALDEHDPAAGRKLHRTAARQAAGADLRPAGVEQHGAGRVQLAAHLAQTLHARGGARRASRARS